MSTSYNKPGRFFPRFFYIYIKGLINMDNREVKRCFELMSKRNVFRLASPL